MTRCERLVTPKGRTLVILPLLVALGIGFALGGRQEDFVIVVLPDTQNYAEGVNGTPEIFKAQTHWVMENREKMNLVYVAHLGDCVQHADLENEWINANEAMSNLEQPPGIPFGIAVGNHDKYIYRSIPVLVDGHHIETTRLYNKYFGVARFQDEAWYGEHYGNDNDNYCHLLSFEDLDFVILYLEYFVNSDVLGWADTILKKYHERRAIVVSHRLLERDGSFSNEGKTVYKTLRDNSNLFLMLCGHWSGELYRTDTFAGNTVHTVMADYQNRENGGDGWLRLLRFSPVDDKIYVTTYSATLDRFETDGDSQFILDYDMSP
jgi:hypothetical protein